MTGKKRYPPEERYRFSQVALLDLCYFANFGAEVAAVSVFPAFFQGNFGLTAALAGAVAGTYGVMNLIAQPGGGLISDKVGSRKWTLVGLLAGMGIIYLVYASVILRLALPLGVIMTTVAAFFVMHPKVRPSQLCH
jgi:NNP family nitrate/nitrite transporter-like MFS transporter